jgi:MraZ protein
VGKPGYSWFSELTKPAAGGHDRAENVFQGETAITIDDKGRLAIPTGYRELIAQVCESRLVITYNPFESGSLFLYPRSVWEKVRDEVNKLPPTRSVSRALQLKLVGAATFVEPDGNGRIGIPASHRSAVGIDKRAVLLGMGDKFELWSEQAHHAQIRKTLGDADLGEAMLDLRL